jgi:hypothetical protein
LGEDTSKLDQRLELPLGLDAFRERGHLVARGELHDRADGRARAVPLSEFLNEGAVDLDRCDRETLEVAQA